MIFDFITGIFNILKAIWNAPAWLVWLVIALIAIVCFVVWLCVPSSGSIISSSSGNGGVYGTEPESDSGKKYDQESTNQIEHAFVFYDSQGNRRGRGDCFYDSKGYRRSWGDSFYDGKGQFRNWGESYYDARGYFRSWGECFYDAKGNLVYPNF